MPPRRTTSGSGSATSEQIEVLMEFLREHPDLARGYIRGPEARPVKNRLWDEIIQRLNSLGGAIKTTQQWKMNDENLHPASEVKDTLEERVVYEWSGGDEENIVPNNNALIDHLYFDDTTSHRSLRSLTAHGSMSLIYTTPAASGTPAVRPPRSSIADSSVSHIHTATAASDTPAVRPPRTTTAQSRTLASGTPTVCPPRPTTAQSRTPTVVSGTPTVCPPSGRARRMRWRSQNRQVDVRGQILVGERAKLAKLVPIREEMAGVREEVAGLREEVAGVRVGIGSLTEAITQLVLISVPTKLRRLTI